MTEIWDLARYVEDHPDDKDQRWRLAKKLYTAWEYRIALEHLQVLKNDWPQKINVRRYIAATYYRLGRYAEAVSELRQATEQWPKELGLYEQMARVLEIAGDRVAASETWDQIAALDPHHPIARSASRRLQEKVQTDARDDLKLGDSDSGIDLSPGQVCPNCGAQNSDEYDHCWQCHADLLPADETGASTPRPKRRNIELSLETVTMAVGLAALAAVSLAVVLTVQMLLHTPEPDTPHTIGRLFRVDLAPTRALLGFLLLGLWPGALWVALGMVDAPYRIPASLINATGALAAGLAYSLTWLAPSALPLAFILPVLVALGIIAGTYRLGWQKALAVWAAHFVLVAVSAFIVSIVVERMDTGQFFNPLREIPAIMAYANEQGTRDKAGAYVLPQRDLPLTQRVTWRKTGSAWLDWRAGDINVAVKSLTPGAELKFEIKDPTGTRVYEFIHEPTWSLPFQFTPGTTYEIIVQGPPGAQAEVSFDAIFVPEFLP